MVRSTKRPSGSVGMGEIFSTLAAGARLVLWRPGTERVAAVPLPAGPARVASSTAGGGIHRVAYRVPAGAGGWYLVHTRMAAAGAGAYTLAYEKR